MKININDKEYYSDDFNEEQLALLQQITSHAQQMAPFEFALSCMQAVQQGLSSQLAVSLEPKMDQGDTAGEEPKPTRKKRSTTKKTS
jgi:hypothetical protein